MQTKLHVPPIRPSIVPRPRLIDLLNQSLHLGQKLTLISAPAGFGKTTLVSDWAHQCRCPLAWLSLDEGDNDLRRFLTYVVAALQKIESSIGQGVLIALHAPGSLNLESLLTTLINEISEIPVDVVLVLDDYHTIEAHEIDKAITFLLDYLPSQMHLMIAGRIDPTLPLARYRARGQMTEIRVQDLRFTPDETAVFLNKVAGFNLSSRDIAALGTRTEGWIAGLQLAALSMQGYEQTSDIANFIDRFTGSNRYIQDYLTDEVLQQRPKGTTDFLLHTSILNRLCAPLCDAVMEHNGSQAILESLESANLFLLPLDDERHWYRYHHLFDDLLSHRLKLTFPDLIPLLHLRASAWYESEGLIDDAIHHAQVAEDVGRVVEILEEHWQDIVHQGELTGLRRLLDSLGPEYTRKSAPLSMAYCWIHIFNKDNALIPGHLEDIRAVLNEKPEFDEGELPMRLAVIPSLFATMEASDALYRKQPQDALHHAQKAMTLIPPNANPKVRQLLQGAAGYRLAYALGELGEFEQAADLMLAGLEMLMASENYLGAAATVLQIVSMYQQLGKTQEALALTKDTLDYITELGWERTPPSGLLHAILADLLADLGDFELARQHLVIGEELAAPLESPDVRIMLDRVEQNLAKRPTKAGLLVEPLSPRELEVLQLIAEGLSNREIGGRLFLALDTVKGHNRNIYGKLGVKNRTQAVNTAVTLKIISER